MSVALLSALVGLLVLLFLFFFLHRLYTPDQGREGRSTRGKGVYLGLPKGMALTLYL